MDAAPYFDTVADGPPGAAHWLTTSDGVRIRVGHWPKADAKGTVLIFPGRTEYVEKYARAAADLAARGYAALAIDYRGQGLADRLHADRGLGHVGAMKDYQLDVAAALDHARALNLPEPYSLIAHSMGGCIGLRALYEGLPVKAAAFSAPMWGIQMSAPMRPVAKIVTLVGGWLGQLDRVVPGQNTKGYLNSVTFADNLLTNDAEMFAYMRNQIATHSDLSLGGPSIRWLDGALRETAGLAARLSPDLPCVTFLGTQEAIVDPDRIHDRMKRWQGGRLSLFDGCKHEIMMDTPANRTRLFDEACALFDAHR